MKRSIVFLTILLGTFLIADFLPAKAEEPKKPVLVQATRPEWKIGSARVYWMIQPAPPGKVKVFEIKEEVVGKEEFKKVPCYRVNYTLGRLNQSPELTGRIYYTEDLNIKARY